MSRRADSRSRHDQPGERDPVAEAGRRGPGGRFLPGRRLGGRPKGAKNKVSAWVQKQVQRLVKNQLRYVARDLAKLRRDGGHGEAVRHFVALLEYVIPKQARTVVEGPGGGPVQVELRRYVTEAPPPPEPRED